MSLSIFASLSLTRSQAFGHQQNRVPWSGVAGVVW
jgi:hypothetical protein